MLSCHKYAANFNAVLNVIRSYCHIEGVILSYRWCSGIRLNNTAKKSTILYHNMAKTKEKALAKEMYMAGKSQKDIARIIGVQEKTVSGWVTKYGWKNEREARYLGKRSQEDNLRNLVSQMAGKAIRLESELETERINGNTDKVLILQSEITRVSDSASKWNKQLESISKENKVSLTTYLDVMDKIFEGIRQYSPKLYMDLVEFQEEHLSEISLKIG